MRNLSAGVVHLSTGRSVCLAANFNRVLICIHGLQMRPAPSGLVQPMNLVIPDTPHAFDGMRSLRLYPMIVAHRDLRRVR